MKNLREIRLKKGMTQVQAAKELNITRQTYYNYETGKRQADYETLLRLGELFGVSVESLIKDDPAEFIDECKTESEKMQKNSASDDDIRSAVIERVEKLSDEQAVRLLAFLEAIAGEKA